MANIDRFMIAPINSGMQTDTKPWLIPEDAFAKLTNAAVFRGRVIKRFGSKLLNLAQDPSVQQLYSRLRIKIGTTDGAGNYGPAVMPGAIWKEGQMFSVGSIMYTVDTTGLILSTDATTTANYVTGTGSLEIFTSTPNTDIFFYPSEPVMGLINYQNTDINNEDLYAFDTQFAYKFNGTAFERLGTAVWHGNDYQFFWGCNWRGVDAQDYILYVTNFNPPALPTNPGDPIRYWNNITWSDLTPTLNSGGTTLSTARLIVSWKGRLILFNTYETTGGVTSQFTSRCRWSQNGTPLTTGDVNAWREDIPGKGGFLDAATKEEIITCSFIKDRLIVYFESSTWELVYTSNQVQPFYWQRINQELGAESTFSVVPFDKAILAVGNVGVHACNGANVDRIDQKIPWEVFQIANNNQGVYRVNGIRDYYMEMAYWAYPYNFFSSKYPNTVLVYNYQNGSWANYEDSITCFGYYQRQDGTTWADTTLTWEQCDFTWEGATQKPQFKDVVAGNQQGFVFIVSHDIDRNASSVQITDITVSGNYLTIYAPNHNLSNIINYIYINNCVGVTNLNDGIYQILNLTTNTFNIPKPSGFSGTYLGGGTISRISQIDILSKDYNFYVDQGRNFYVSKVDFLVTNTGYADVDPGENKTINVKVDYFNSTSSESQLDDAEDTGALIGNGFLELSPYDLVPSEKYRDMFWHPMYLQGDGEFIQLHIYLDATLISTDNQDFNKANAFAPFELHAMTFYVTPTASRMQ